MSNENGGMDVQELVLKNLFRVKGLKLGWANWSNLFCMSSGFNGGLYVLR